MLAIVCYAERCFLRRSHGGCVKCLDIWQLIGKGCQDQWGVRKEVPTCVE